MLYSCLETETCFFNLISLLKIIIEDNITNIAPHKVLSVGISPQIKKPKIIAKISARYFNGVTKDTSENLYAWLNHKFAAPPNIPKKVNITKSLKLGIIHPLEIVARLVIVIAIEKLREINHTGSVLDNCLIEIATYAIPRQNIMG